MSFGKILCVAEKPSVAKSISYILYKNPQVEQTASIYNKIFKFPYYFQNQQKEILFTSVAGHLKQLKYLDKYKNWQSWDPLVILNQAEIEIYIPDDKMNIYNNLKSLSPKCDSLILWLDCDREGENIAFEVLEVCRQFNPTISVYRAHFSALTKTDINKAFNTLRQPDKNLSDAVNARQEIDLRIGAAFTRFQTLLLRRSFSLQGVVSYGPCQFPTLGFVVSRHMLIENFVPEKFWSRVSDGSEQQCIFNWDRGKLFSEYEALIFYEICLGDNHTPPVAEVTKTESHSTQKYKPVPLSTVEFEKLATKNLRISAHQAMEIAEKLYNQGYISYPRTETNSFPNTMNLKDLVEQQRNHSVWGNYASELLDYNHFDNPRHGGKDDHAHPPIHPVKQLNPQEAGSELEYKIYELITRHFLACCSKNAQGLETNINIQVMTEGFHAKGLIIKQRNYLDSKLNYQINIKVYPYDKWTGSIVPEMSQGDKFNPNIDDISLQQGTTTPPKPLTETELISLMDIHGIGTDATIHEHIKTIQDRDYARKTGQVFKPTKLGIALVETYRTLGLTLHMPDLRATMEERMNFVAQGSKNKNEMIKDTIKDMEIILADLQRNKQSFINTVGTYLQQLQNYTVDEEGNEVPVRESEMGQCGICLNQMKYREMSDGEKHLHCQHCKRIYKLPFEGQPKYKPQVCPLCQFQVIEILKNDGKSYIICPHCYTNPPDDQFVEKMPCFACKNSTCQFSASSRVQATLYDCQQCKNPMLIRQTKKQTFFIGCSKFPSCRQSVFLPDFIKKVKVDDQKCQKCKDKGITSMLVQLEFSEDELMFGPLLIRAQDKQTLYCLQPSCDPDIGSQIRLPQNKQTQIENQQKSAPIRTYSRSQQQNSLKTQQNAEYYTINLNHLNNYIQFEEEKTTFKENKQQNSKNECTCFKCGEVGHYANQCPQKKQFTKQQNKYEFEQNKQEHVLKQEHKPRQKKACNLCGIIGRHPKNSQCTNKINRKKNQKSQQSDEDIN